MEHKFENLGQTVETDGFVDDIIENTEVVLVDGELLDRVKKIVAKEYTNFMRVEERDEGVAYRDLCLDDFSEEGLTFALLYKDPCGSGKEEILASCRLLFGSELKDPPLEAMSLIDVIDKKTGLSSWPYDDLGEKIELNEVCEIGRFVSADLTRKDPVLQFYTASSLLGAVYRHAREHGAKYLMSIMPNYVYQFVLRNGTNASEINTNKIITFVNTPEALYIREKYPLYWERKPSLYLLDMCSYED